MRLTDPTGGETVALAVGDRLSIDLREPGSAGYKWRVTAAGSAVELVIDSFQAPAPERIGAAGVRHLEFLARQPGSAQVKLRLVRPWEPDKPHAAAEIRVRVLAD